MYAFLLGIYLWVELFAQSLLVPLTLINNAKLIFNVVPPIYTLTRVINEKNIDPHPYQCLALSDFFLIITNQLGS